jgi:hypothetical protein
MIIYSFRSGSAKRRQNETDMDQDIALPPKRRLTAQVRILPGRKSTSGSKRAGPMTFVPEENLTPRRIRRIIREALQRPVVDDNARHAKLQLARLAPALRVACAAVEAGQARATNTLLKVLDQLDRYQKPAFDFQNHYNDAMERLLPRTDGIAANPLLARRPGPPESTGVGMAPSERATPVRPNRNKPIRRKVKKNRSGVAVTP